jgi:hypothetical protein
MSATLRLAARFALVFAIALAVLAALWTVAAPRYGAAVAAAAGPAFRWAERDDVTVLAAEADEIWVYRRMGPNQVAPFMYFDRYAFFAVIPLLALFAATPGLRLRRRAVWAASGLCALFLVHVGYVVASVELSYAAAGLSASGPHELAQWIVRLLWEAAPIAIWLAFTARAWMRAVQTARGQEGDRTQRDRVSAGIGRTIAWTPREGRTE